MGNTCKRFSNKNNVAIPSRTIRIQVNPKQINDPNLKTSNINNDLASASPIDSKPAPSEAQATGEPEEEVKENVFVRPLIFKYDLQELGIGEYYLEKELGELKNSKGKAKQEVKLHVKWDRAVVQMRVRFPQGLQDSILYNQTDMFLKEYSLTKPKAFAAMLKNGPPMRYRWSVWKNYLEPDQFYVEDLYKKLKGLSTPYEKVITKDLHRTFPDEAYFSSERFNNIGQEQLFNVLKALTLYFPNTGYTQSMNFIAAFLLLVSGGNEFEAFWAFVALARGNKFLMMGFFENEFPLLKFYLYLFQEQLELEIPRVHEHLKAIQIPEELLLMKWFMSFFIYSLQPKQVVRIWDFIMAEGSLGLIKVGLGILKVVEKDILNLDAVGIHQFFEYLNNGGNRGGNNMSQSSHQQNQGNMSNIPSQVIAQNPNNQSHLHTNQSHTINQSINNPQIPTSQNFYNINLTQRDHPGVAPSVQNETSEMHFMTKELDINEVLAHAENIILTVERLLYLFDLYTEKTKMKLPEPYYQFFKDLHLYQNDPNKLVNFQKEVDFHLLKCELSNKPNEEIVVCNLLDDVDNNTLILKDLVL